MQITSLGQSEGSLLLSLHRTLRKRETLTKVVVSHHSGNLSTAQSMAKSREPGFCGEWK